MVKYKPKATNSSNNSKKVCLKSNSNQISKINLELESLVHKKHLLSKAWAPLNRKFEYVGSLELEERILYLRMGWVQLIQRKSLEQQIIQILRREIQNKWDNTKIWT